MNFATFVNRLVTLILMSLLLGACSSNTKLTTDWKNPDVSGAPLTKVAVIAIANDEGIRRYAEDQMIEKMPKNIARVAGYTMFDKPEKNVTTVREQLIKNGFNGVLVMRLVKIDKSQEYVPPRTIVENYGSPYGRVGYYGSFNGYYGNAYNATYVTTTPGYTKTNTNVIVETMLYRLPDGELMWTGTTDTLNPDVKSELVDAITDIVKSKISQDGLLSSK